MERTLCVEAEGRTCGLSGPQEGLGLALPTSPYQMPSQVTARIKVSTSVNTMIFVGLWSPHPAGGTVVGL